MTLLQEQKQKHYLNQGSGSFTLHGLESKPGSEGMVVNLESASNKHVKRTPSKAIRTWLDHVLICKWSAWDWTSAQSHIGTFVDIVLWPLDVKSFCQLGYLRITARADQTWCFLFSCLLAHCFRGRWPVLEWLFLRSSLFSLSSFLVFPLSPYIFIYRLRNLRGSSKWRPEGLLHASISLLPDINLHFLLDTFFCSYCPAPPWSLPQLLSQQMWRIPLGKEETPDVALCCFIGWLHVLCVTVLSTQSSSSTLRFNPSIDCDVKMKKKFLKIQSGWLDTIFFIVDEGVTLCFSVATELNLTFLCGQCMLFSLLSLISDIGAVSHFKLSPHSLVSP